MDTNIIELDAKSDLEFQEAVARCSRENPAIGLIIYETEEEETCIEVFGKEVLNKDILWMLEYVKSKLLDR